MVYERVAARHAAPCVVAGLVFLNLAVACSTPDNELSGAPTTSMVDLKSGEHLTGTWSAGLVIERDISYVLGFSSGDSSAMWSLRIPLTREQALSGALSLPVSPVAETGVASISDGKGTVATSGSVAVKFGKGSIDGTADVQPDTLSGRFYGEFGVSCSVPISVLGAHAPQSRSGDDAEVVDAELVSDTCAPFKVLTE
ncbi:MAG TPA: hypothetical protein VIU64_14065 [Polyangia bacterium]